MNTSANSSNQFLSGTGTATIDPGGLNAGTGAVELDGGVFLLGGSDRIDDAASLIVHGAVFSLGTFNETVNAVTLAGGSILGTNGALTSLNAFQTRNGSVSAILAGAVGLTQSTNGTTIVSGADIYTGDTTVAAGTASRRRLAPASAVAVQSGATFPAQRRARSPGAAISSSGIIAPGDASTGTLSTGNITLGPGALDVDLTSAAAYDEIVSTGTVNLTGASLNLNANLGSIQVNDSFILVTGTSIAGTFNGGSTVTVGSRQFSITYNPTSVVLTAMGNSSVSVTGTLLNEGNTYINSSLATAQHSMVESVVYSFSAAVSLIASNFTITGIHGTTIVPTLHVTPNGANTVWTVTFAGAGVNAATNSIGDGEYEIVLGGVSGLTNNTFDFYRLMGDMDGNGLVNIADFSTMVGTFLRATTDPAYLGADDLDGDGAIGIGDISQLVGNFLHSVPTPMPN